MHGCSYAYKILVLRTLMQENSPVGILGYLVNSRLVYYSVRSVSTCSLPHLQSNAGGITVLDFKLCFRVVIIKIAWHWHKNRLVGHWMRREVLGINLIFEQLDIWTRWLKHALENRASSTNGTQKLCICIHNRSLRLAHFASLCTELSSKWTEDINLRLEPLETLKGNRGSP